MNHSFTESAVDKTKCRCGRSEVDHGSAATCDGCGNTCGVDGKIIGSLETVLENGNKVALVNNALLCLTCYDIEIKAREVKELQTPAKEILNVSRQIDASIQIKEEIFTAETVAIVELQAAIERDTSITEKHFTLSRAIEERFNKFTSVLHDIKNQQQELLNKQRALQTFYQDLAKKLTLEQREQIKLKDLNYKPEPPKLVKTKSEVKKFDMHALKFVAQQTGFPMQVLQTICLNRNVQPVEAARILKELSAK